MHQDLLDAYMDNVNCTASNTACVGALSLSAILNGQATLLDQAVNGDLDEAAGSSEPIRPVRDNVLITSTLDSTAPFPKVSKPVIVSTMRNEAGPTIYGGFPDTVNDSFYEQLVSFTFGTPRTDRILDTAVYAVSPAVDGVDTDQRPTLEALGTDQIWRCASWQFARNWVGNGGKAYVGEYMVGATYPGNDEVPFCKSGGAVCHQDDIEIVVSHLAAHSLSFQDVHILPVVWHRAQPDHLADGPDQGNAGALQQLPPHRRPERERFREVERRGHGQRERDQPRCLRPGHRRRVQHQLLGHLRPVRLPGVQPLTPPRLRSTSPMAPTPSSGPHYSHCPHIVLSPGFER